MSYYSAVFQLIYDVTTYFDISFLNMWLKQYLLYLTRYTEGNISSIFKDITINYF